MKSKAASTANPNANNRHWYSAFLFLTWLHMLWITSGFISLQHVITTVEPNTAFQLSAWFFYSFLYISPILICMLLCRIAHIPKMAVMITTLVISILTLLLIKIDNMIFQLYSFHINRFVLNLIFTPGGISSLGGTNSSYLSVSLMIGVIVSLQAALLFASINLKFDRLGKLSQRRWKFAALLLCFVTQGTVYGISDITQNGTVLQSAKAFPLFQRIRFRSMAKHFGYAPTEQSHYAVNSESSGISYPLQPVEYVTPASRPNIILLVSESMRWDQLNAEIMPNTWQFAQQNQHFRNHYSSGNGTREGLFGMFYGLYGSYWEPFLHARRSPLLIQRLIDLGYQFDLRTGATFTYPEFDRTLFVDFPKSELIEADDKLEPWERDELNTNSLLSFIDATPASQPFMSFVFYESTHASYSFPEAAALYSEYEQDVDYTQLSQHTSPDKLIPLFNRYHNASHWIDVQLGKIYGKLEQSGRLDNTIVIVTGDHGEEFLDKGAWGHNSTFVEEQTHVPMVVHMPGKTAQRIDNPTIHLDIATTLLQVLGAPEQTDNYSLGRNLFDTSERAFMVLSDWHSISVQTSELKYRIPYLNSGADYWEPTGVDDQPLPASVVTLLTTRNQAALMKAITDCSIFLKHDG